MTDHTHALEGWLKLCLPGIQQVAEDRIEALFGRVPWFAQVMVQANVVDGPNGGFRVGIRRQQHATRLGIDADRLGQKFDTGHVRHALVDDHQGHGVVAQLQLTQGLQCRGTRICAHDAVVFPVLAPQITLHRTQHHTVIIDCQ